jgi:hypothetical protein
MKLSDLILIRLRIRSRVAARPQSPACLVALVEYLEVVFEGAHPRTHLLFLGARQKTDVLADRHRDAGHDDFAVALVSSTWVSPAASVSRVLPVPAWPSRVTKSTPGSSAD